MSASTTGQDDRPLYLFLKTQLIPSFTSLPSDLQKHYPLAPIICSSLFSLFFFSSPSFAAWTSCWPRLLCLVFRAWWVFLSHSFIPSALSLAHPLTLDSPNHPLYVVTLTLRYPWRWTRVRRLQLSGRENSPSTLQAPLVIYVCSLSSWQLNPHHSK